MTRPAATPGIPSGRRVLLGYGLVGAVLGIFALHPLTMVIYWFEFHDHAATTAATVFEFVLTRTARSFTLPMWPMTGSFALVGTVTGLLFARLHLSLVGGRHAIGLLEQQLVHDIPSLIEAGEDAHTEFKSTARWDLRQNRPGKVMEKQITKSIAAFSNHQGGSLIVGVDDDGGIVGLEHDYQTLRQPNRDGFEEWLTGLLKDRLGADICAQIRILFTRLEGRDVCRIIVEPGYRPTYCQDGKETRYFLRMGNSSRELDVRETVQHVAFRWPDTASGHAPRRMT